MCKQFSLELDEFGFTEEELPTCEEELPFTAEDELPATAPLDAGLPLLDVGLLPLDAGLLPLEAGLLLLDVGCDPEESVVSDDAGCAFPEDAGSALSEDAGSELSELKISLGMTGLLELSSPQATSPSAANTVAVPSTLIIFF